MNPSTPSPGRGASTRRRWWLGLALALVALAGTIVLAYGDKLRAKTDDKNKIVTLQFAPGEVTRPQRMAMPQLIEFSGPLVAPRTAVVRAKASGTLLALDVAEGSRVKAGQLLGRIDLSELTSRVADRRAAVESAEAALAEAERQYEANRRLADEHFIAPTALQTSQARLDAARAQLKSGQALLAMSRVGVRDAALVAPISGVVGKRHVVPGEKLAAEQNVITIVDLSTLELAGTVGTHEVSRLAVGQPVSVRVEGQTPEQAAGNRGRIDRIAPAAEAGTRAIGVVVVLDNRDERLRAGQYGEATVRLADDSRRLTVPLGAVTQSSGQEQVWTIEHGALVRRIVITGRRDVGAGRVEVLRGLADDALVLAASFDNLKEGAPAQVRGATPEAASATAVPANKS
jgi:RND family efflux transporter MFP subunit